MMHIVAVGLDHKGSSLPVREKLAVPQHKINMELQNLLHCPHIREALVLSTCNRFELYVCTAQAPMALPKMMSFFHSLQPERSSPVDPEYTLLDEKAVFHLFRVASGLESLIPGETQILSQLKNAYAQAVENQTIGPALSRLFQLALHCGKRVRHETEISKGAMSTGAAAVQLVGRRLGSWKNKKVLVIGAGKAGQMCVKTLLGLKQKPDITVLNQSLENIKQVAFLDPSNSLTLSTSFEECHQLAAEVDAVFVTTASANPVIKKHDFEFLGSWPEFIVDLSVPRNVEPLVAELDGLTLFTLDELKSTVDLNVARRATLLGHVEGIINDVVSNKWMKRYASAG
ncbi:MAG: glutamyl-tRNA reductase [Candidatus Obscuribacterales bacterium]|jgi:glutamyl-tRNA reductase|nr:glutamyl-tRNA reductase [Candidatus Obscuribacterales bacterium]